MNNMAGAERHVSARHATITAGADVKVASYLGKEMYMSLLNTT